ncbi:pre-peptidase C-terminal domain-containing protein [Kribbella sp. DT2]|uniref:PPC domain-containing protein n=1 Tax=Kribbella sp. DT2 TaxID=3393427 RepID=UPI003CFACE2B
MRNKYRRTLALTAGGAVALSTLALVGGNPAGAAVDPLDEIAQGNGLSVQKVRDTLADTTSRLDRTGHLFFQEPALTSAQQTEEASPRWASASARAAEGPAFELHSKAGANRVIYLDFDGHSITGTAWNADKGIDPVNVSPYDTDGDPAVFSTAEQDVVHEVWARVAEDYAPFDVDVTTQEPPQDAINRSDAADEQYGTRVLIDPDTWYQSGCGCGGVAYIGVYDAASQHDYYQPALVFTKGVGTGAKNLAEAASHEAGHNVGLGHDGTATVGYYEGHGAWAPIMGVGYYRAISQWSKGEYAGANNTEDDYTVISSHGLPLRPDDHADTPETATALTIGTPALGVITTETDTDVFRVDVATAGTYTATVTPAPTGANLDAQLDLLNSAGTPMASANPASGQSDAGTPTGLDATITTELQPGTYYLRLDNTANADPATTGYSTYGSRGAYTLAINPT